MLMFKKKADPISRRAKALTAEIAALESQIRKLDTQLQGRVDSLEHPPAEGGADAPVSAPADEPIFEQVDQNRLQARGELAVAPEHFNELGVRKYDLPALVGRIRNHFRGPSASNPKLINYLAAGGIQGLRPLRYEKRIARNRFLLFTCLLFAALFGILWWLAWHPR